MDWTVTAEASPQQETSTAALAIDVDPRRRLVSLGLRRRSGGSQELFANVIARRFTGTAAADWSAAAAWLRTATAEALLAAILSGYRAEMVWSGDWVADWTPAARAALDDLQRNVLARL